MRIDKKVIYASGIGVLFGTVIGAVAFFHAYTYYYSDFYAGFYSNMLALTDSNRLNSNIKVLKLLRSGDIEKPIELLESEARINLVTVGAYEMYIDPRTRAAGIESIIKAKEYFSKYPITNMSEDEEYLFNQAYSRIEKYPHNN